MPPYKPISEVSVDFERLTLNVRYDQIKDLAKDAAQLIKSEAESIARGSIKQGIKMQVERGSTLASVEVKVGADKKHWYARFFETGTRPHEIRARRAKVLVSKAGVFYGKHVRHPGMAADPILSKAVEIRGKQAADLFAKGIRQIIIESFA